MEVRPETQLQQGLEMTRQMLELVKSGEWERLTELAEQRIQLLRQWSQSTDPNRAQVDIGLLQEIQAIDREIVSLGRQGRDEAASKLQQIRQGRKAGKAYGK